jgi:hypothetical protein
METIFKYALNMDGDCTVLRLPAQSTPLTVQMQGNTPMLWVKLDPDSPQQVLRTFRLCVTGGEVPETCTRYIGSFQAGWFVGHVFEEALLPAMVQE